MNNAAYTFQLPKNEPIKQYAKGSKEREDLLKEVERQSNMQIEIPLIIGGKEIKTGDTGTVVMPHKHSHVLATYHKAGEKEVQMAIDAAMEAHKTWSRLDWQVRASILLKAADLLATKYRNLINASTMLGQSKNVFQAEIDAACETIDFLRFNVAFANKIYQDQPVSADYMLNRIEFRPLEGFVFTVSPFNFTAIASNLNASPVLMGNVTVWKPATTALLSNYYLMQVFKEAGMPDGVINFVPGKGSVIGGVVMNDPNFAGIHFTGSNNTFNHLWQTSAQNLPKYKSYPRIVGETGGKDFIFVHPTADVAEVAANAVRGAYEFQGQKCSAASRMYVPKSLWGDIKESMLNMIGEIKMGEVNDTSNFMNAIIDEPAFDSIKSYVDFAKESNEAEIVVGGTCDKSVGFFIEPTIIETTNPKFKTMDEEIFGPVLTVYAYEDNKVEEALELLDTTSPYGLTGAVFARDRVAAAQVCDRLRYAAGNFYINDKPTGAVVGQQPFGGSRGSGTNDKAGGDFNLLRWVSPRTIKETFTPATCFKYPFLEQ